MDRLTIKQNKFINEYVKSNGNGQQSAMKVYDVKNENVARSIASQNLIKVNVRERLDKILQKDSLNLLTITDKLSTIIVSDPVKGYSGSDILEAVKTGLKLHGVLSDRKQITNVNIDAHLSSLSKYELIQLHNKKKKDIDTIINGEEIK
jgi:phage terminase small subunit